MALKYMFFDDYSEGADPRILEAFGRTNLDQERGYSGDRFVHEAQALIRKAARQPQARVYFVASGTQANLVCLAAMLQPYESVIAVETAHINTHEAGAIEATGHKINVVAGADGKLTPEAVEQIVAEHAGDEQMVKPKAVYISQSTELGTIYNKQEMSLLAKLCQQHGLYLYIDGARLGSALASSLADFDLADIANLADIFYIGGTKNGALIGEAIVIVNPALQKNFGYQLRQRGALLAKARAVSLQFAELFKDDLYLELAKHANAMATLLAEGIKTAGYKFLTPIQTNQLFPILPDVLIKQLAKDYGFYPWPAAVAKGHSAIRMVTSWATPDSAVQEFLADLKKVSK